MLACYVYLLTLQPAESIILAGDSAGAGMVLATLCLLRDQGQPLPAGAVLISPWVDLCHSFPSAVTDYELGNRRGRRGRRGRWGGCERSDYIPAHGFLHRPSEAWPPVLPASQPAAKAGAGAGAGAGTGPAARPATHPAADSEADLAADPETDPETDSETDPGTDPKREPLHQPEQRHPRLHRHHPAPCPRVTIDGREVELHDQIQMYTTNDMLTHPLVSPVNQCSLSGLCPLLVLSGGGEVLRDEQAYVAHKAAFPHVFGDPDDPRPPTRVWLQVFARACHVVPALAWTRPAKMVGATIATFARQVWPPSPSLSPAFVPVLAPDDQLAGFRFEIVSLPHGSRLRPPLTPQDFPPRERIGMITPEPVRLWLEAKARWDAKYASATAKLRHRQLRHLQCLGRADEGGRGGDGGGKGGEGWEEGGEEEEESVPLSAAYRRRHRKRGPGRPAAAGGPEKAAEGPEKAAEGQARYQKGWGMSLWVSWSDRNMVRRG